MNGTGDDVILNNLFPLMAFSAKTVVSDFLEDVPADLFRYRDKRYINKELLDIKLLILVQIGSNDTSALTASKEYVTEYLNNNFKTLKLIFIENTNHRYIGKEEEMSNNCIKFIEENK